MRARDGFSLIELMVVVMIIALVAALSVAEFNGMQPHNKVTAHANLVRSVLLGAKTRAVRDRQLTKVCFFSDLSPKDNVAAGRYLVLECNNWGNQGCGANPVVCVNTDAASSQGAISNALTGTPDLCTGAACNSTPCPNVPSNASNPPYLGDSQWCLINDVDMTQGTYSNYHVSINSFYDYSGATNFTTGNNQKALELTYDDTGAVAPAYSSANGGNQGEIWVTNFDQCLPGPANSGGTQCTGFFEVFKVRYTLAGSPTILN